MGKWVFCILHLYINACLVVHMYIYPVVQVTCYPFYRENDKVQRKARQLCSPDKTLWKASY